MKTTPASRRKSRKDSEDIDVLKRQLSNATDKQLLLMNKLIDAEDRIEQLESGDKRICVACKTYHPRDHFDQARQDFPTRDGLQYNCQASNSGTTYRLMRAPSGKVEQKQ